MYISTHIPFCLDDTVAEYDTQISLEDVIDYTKDIGSNDANRSFSVMVAKTIVRKYFSGLAFPYCYDVSVDMVKHRILIKTERLEVSIIWFEKAGSPIISKTKIAYTYPGFTPNVSLCCCALLQDVLDRMTPKE